jgi:hypothetical protein
MKHRVAAAPQRSADLTHFRNTHYPKWTVATGNSNAVNLMFG